MSSQRADGRPSCAHEVTERSTCPESHINVQRPYMETAIVFIIPELAMMKIWKRIAC